MTMNVKDKAAIPNDMERLMKARAALEDLGLGIATIKKVPRPKPQPLRFGMSDTDVELKPFKDRSIKKQ